MDENENKVSAEDTDSQPLAETTDSQSSAETTDSQPSAETTDSQPSAENEPEIDEECLNKAIYMLIKLNMGTDKTKEALMNQGYSEEQAHLCITQVAMLHGVLGTAADKAAKEEIKKESTKMILIGIGCIALGIVATLISYNMASPGERFRAWWGIAVYGLYALGKGIYYKFK